MAEHDRARAAPAQTSMAQTAIEAKLIVLRKLVAHLIASTPQGSPIRAFLADRAVIADGQEDPGSVPEPAFALEAAIAEEFRLMADEVDRYGGRTTDAPSGQ